MELYFHKSNIYYESWKNLISGYCQILLGSTPIEPNFQQLLIEAENSEEYESNFPYREIVGSLMFASTATRPDLTTALEYLVDLTVAQRKFTAIWFVTYYTTFEDSHHYQYSITSRMI